jgi:hypothetical protein
LTPSPPRTTLKIVGEKWAHAKPEPEIRPIMLIDNITLMAILTRMASARLVKNNRSHLSADSSHVHMPPSPVQFMNLLSFNKS